LGADTRATEGSIVCDKNCEKIHYISPKIYCCGAGTSGDLESVTGKIIWENFDFNIKASFSTEYPLVITTSKFKIFTNMNVT
jgi:20S proteasome alpha/beta subunit